VEETDAIVQKEVHVCLNKKKINASEKKKQQLDPELVKRTVGNLMRAPAQLDDNNVRTLKKTVIATKRNTRATAAAAKKKETLQKVKKSVPQLGEQAKQSLAPLKVFSDDIVDENGMVRGTKIGDYMPADVHFESMEEVATYRYGHPLVKPGTSLTTMMRRLQTWYLDCCKSSSGQDNLFIMVKENQDDLVAIGLVPVQF